MGPKSSNASADSEGMGASQASQAGRRVLAKEVAAKMSTKIEVYNFLTVNCRGFLPPYGKLQISPHLHQPFDTDTVTIYWLKDLVAGKKKFLKGKQGGHQRVPQYECLTMAKILGFCAGYAAFDDYMPDPKEIKRLPKQWICDVADGLIGEEFGDWVLAQVGERNEALKQKHNLEIEMDPEVYEAFLASTAVSSKSQLPPPRHHPDPSFVTLQRRKATAPTC